MQHFSVMPMEMFRSAWRHRELILEIAKREVLGRYRGSILGIFWSLFNPLLMLAVYTLVFSEVFKAKWGSGSESKTEFALVLFSGLIAFNLFAECINRAPSLIISNQNYVKKIVFPLEILPIVSLLSSLYHAIMSLSIWLVAYLIFFGIPSATAFLLPIVLLPFMLLILGVSWIFASLGVYLRDVSQFIGVTTTVLSFMSPVFYPISAIPVEYRKYLYLNPLTPAIEQIRGVLYFGQKPDIWELSSYYIFALIMAWLGFLFFQKTRKGFADVL